MAKFFLSILMSGGLTIVILFYSTASRGMENRPIGARSLALSHASVSFSDSWSVFNNQAGLTEISSLRGIVFFESKFGIDELSLVAGSLSVPAGKGAFSFSAWQFGSGSFRESKYGMAYAHALSEKWSAGLQMDYVSRLLPENSRSQGFYTMEGGLLFYSSAKLQLGVHLFNPVQGGFNTHNGIEVVPWNARAGGHYFFEKKVLAAWEVMKSRNAPAMVKTGIEFLPADSFAVRLGVSGKPVAFTAGFGMHWGDISADIAFAWHGNLGITPAVSVQFGL